MPTSIQELRDILSKDLSPYFSAGTIETILTLIHNEAKSAAGEVEFPVVSVFGRDGDVEAAEDDYGKEQIEGLKTSDSPQFKLVITKTITNDGSSNGVEIYDSGDNLIYFVNSKGFRKIKYRDEYVAGPWVEASGAAAPDLVNYTIGGVGTRKYSFDGNNTEERLSNSFEIPHDIALDEINAETQRIEMHIHWMPSTNTAGDVKWFVDYCYIPVTQAPISQSSLSVVAPVAINRQYFHHINAFAGTGGVISIPKPSSGFNLGDVIEFNLRRTPSDQQDTYGADAILIKVALHVPVNDDGSRQLYVK